MKKFNIRIALYIKHDAAATRATIDQVMQVHELKGTWDRWTPAILFRQVDPVTILPVLEAVLKMNCGLSISVYHEA